MTFRSLLVMLMLFGFGVLANGVNADVVEDLYESTIPVKSQERQDREDAIRQALTEVLIRVSGHSSMIDNDAFPRIKAALVNATNYAQQFRYRDRSADKYIAAGEFPLELWVRFDPPVVNKLLRENNIAVWDKTRPATLVWLVVDERGRREFFGASTQHPARPMLDTAARMRGLPLRLPQQDSTDHQSIAVNEVWGNFEEVILRASKRYQTEAVLVGRLLQEPNGLWGSRWTLYHDGRHQNWTNNGVSLETAIALGVDKSTEDLASRYAQVSLGEEVAVNLQINSIKTLNDYNRTLKYLRTLAQVKSVQTVSIQGDKILFKVITNAGRLGLSRALSLSQVLTSESQSEVRPGNPASGSETTTATASAELVFRLMP